MDVTAAVIIEDGRVLLTLRPQGKEHPGFWEFPGGKVEEGENASDCLRREILEELGVEIEVGEEVAAIDHEFGDKHIRLIAFMCRLMGGEVRDLGCETHDWVRLEETGKMKLLPPDRKLSAIIVFGEN